MADPQPTQAAFLGGFPARWPPRRRLALSESAARSSCSRVWRAATIALGALLSFGQDPRWRRAMVAAVAAGPPRRVLDVATGTGLVARRLVATLRVLGGRRSTRAPRCSPGRDARSSARPELAASASSWSRARPSGFRFADRRVRPPHLHLPAALRRRPGGDARRARPGGQARRAHRLARVRPARSAAVAAAVAALHPGRPAGARPARSAATGTRWAASWDRASRSSTSAGRCERQLELWERAGISLVRQRRMSLGGGRRDPGASAMS